MRIVSLGIDYPLRRVMGRRSQALVAIAALAVILAVAALEYLLGDSVSLSLVYLLPVAAATWLSGSFLCGLPLAAAAALTIPSLTLMNKRAYRSLLVASWNGVARFLLFALVVYLILTVCTLLQ